MAEIILGLGVGQCGLKLLSDLLSAQPDTLVTHEDTPFLPWKPLSGKLVGCETLPVSMVPRLARWRQKRPQARIGDVASFYLPYAEEMMEIEPRCRMICLRRPKEEVVRAFQLGLQQTSRRPTDNWRKELPRGWYRNPRRMEMYPKYDVSSRKVALERYYDEYYARAELLAQRFPERFQIFDPQEWETEEGVRKVLTFAGIPPAEQKILTGNKTPLWEEPLSEEGLVERWNRELETLPPSHCVVLVPFLGSIHQECDAALKELERRGYPVRRVGGYSAIDQGRNQMATEAILDGFEETLWIDSDIAFHPDDVGRLRSHRLPLTAALYPQKGRRALASHVMPGAQGMTFGKQGGLTEMLYVGTGFLLVRREVYLKMQELLQFPVCNERFGKPMIPFFQPLIRTIEDGSWYLAEDYAFCHRARACGYSIFADTRIRLGHIGTYPYSWEDAGIERPRFASFTLNFTTAEQHGNQMIPPVSLQNLLREYAFPEEGRWEDWEEAKEMPLSQELLTSLKSALPPQAKYLLTVGDYSGKMTSLTAQWVPNALIIGCNPPSPHWPPECFYQKNRSLRQRVFLANKPTQEIVTSLLESGILPEKIFFYAENWNSFSQWSAELSFWLEQFPQTPFWGTGYLCDDIRKELPHLAAKNHRELAAKDETWQMAPMVHGS